MGDGGDGRVGKWEVCGEEGCEMVGKGEWDRRGEDGWKGERMEKRKGRENEGWKGRERRGCKMDVKIETHTHNKLKRKYSHIFSLSLPA